MPQYTRIEDPNVESHMSAANTQDMGLNRLGNLITAAPLVTEEGEDDFVLITTRAEFLRTYCPPNPQGIHILTADLHPSHHHIYEILGDTSVLVCKVGVDYTSSHDTIIPGNGTTLAELFGTGAFIKFEGAIGLSDAGDSYYLNQAGDEILDTKLSFNFGELSVNSSTFSNIIGNLYNEGVYLYGYRYNQDSELTAVFLFNHGSTNQSNVEGILTGVTYPVSANMNIDNYEFILIGYNPIGYTINNHNHSNVNFKVSSVNISGNTLIMRSGGVDYNVTFLNSGSWEGIVEDSTTLTLLVNQSFDISNVVPDEDLEFNDYVRPDIDPTYELDDDGNANENVIPEVITTINSIVEYDGGYRIDFVFDAGIDNEGVRNAIYSVCDSIGALGLVTRDNTKYDTFEEFVDNNMDNKNERVYSLAPMQIVNYGTYSMYVSPIIEYIRAVSRNKGNNSEFAPVFGLQNGTITNHNLSRIFTKTEREILNGVRINSIKLDKFRGTVFINNNTTGLSNDNMFNEEFIVRIANRISWDVDYLMENFLGELDVETTASNAKTTIETYINSTIMSQRYAPSKVEVVCDGTNNSFGDGELIIDIYVYIGRALKKIKVYTKVLPLSALTQEQ